MFWEELKWAVCCCLVCVPVCTCLAAFHFIVRVLLTLAYSRFHPSGVSSLSSFSSSSHSCSIANPFPGQSYSPSLCGVEAKWAKTVDPGRSASISISFTWIIGKTDNTDEISVYRTACNKHRCSNLKGFVFKTSWLSLSSLSLLAHTFQSKPHLGSHHFRTERQIEVFSLYVLFSVIKYIRHWNKLIREIMSSKQIAGSLSDTLTNPKHSTVNRVYFLTLKMTEQRSFWCCYTGIFLVFKVLRVDSSSSQPVLPAALRKTSGVAFQLKWQKVLFVLFVKQCDSRCACVYGMCTKRQQASLLF